MVNLSIYRGSADQINSVFSQIESQLRQLPPGAAPPPRVLPPPPSTETGEMVIDQPAFTRTASDKFDVEFSDGQRHHTTGNHSEWKQKSLSALPTVGHGYRSATDDGFLVAALAARMRQTSPFGRPRTVATVSGTDYSTATWPGPISREPVNREPVNFQVKRAPARPWIWQPSMMYEIHTDEKSEPIKWQQLPDVNSEEAARRNGHQRDYPDGRDVGNKRNHYSELSIPKWALPLRSDYDWKKSYPWAGDENMAPLHDDEWEYIFISDGTVIKRKS